MISGLIHDNLFDYVYSLIIDVLIFTVKAIYFFAETVFLTILPTRFRTLKVGWIFYEVQRKECLEKVGT